MSKRILITGGAGFIGSHLAGELLHQGHRVRVLDPLSPQVQGDGAKRRACLDPDVELLCGCVEDAELIGDALVGVDAVYHLAAKVGAGQSMYEINDYATADNAGTAVLLEALLRHPVERLVVASSMSIYGEGLYRDSRGALVPGALRSLEQLKACDWELRDHAGLPLTPVPTPETKEPALASACALSKFDQERMCLLVGRAYSIPTVALRFFNVYGPRQSRSNPSTDVLAIFASQLLNDCPPIIFEDGRQRRDFVNVRDIARACRLALDAPDAPGHVFNIGSGQHVSVHEIATRLGRILDKPIEPEIAQRYRVGDIRHCFADITRARQLLGYAPAVSLEEGLAEFAGWFDSRTFENRFAVAS